MSGANGGRICFCALWLPEGKNFVQDFLRSSMCGLNVYMARMLFVLEKFFQLYEKTSSPLGHVVHIMGHQSNTATLEFL